ncbi:DUF1311 domain-containing protein [Undibacterium sp. LX40W]|uniref:DUF1311 domain-containing protein n=1 Tax=Undibacterium nitidum TaxID=2762298 RepID=A0A923HNF8_9BURK|nr:MULTISPECIES: lysozyme inhibitor LprI family protein [Undibacterium]MBC3881608.1 DUF1311 domain-containing protein [Undibacterium nitidum]MBC3891609.1 DUF1311 domain-containing protein [Undibacterium sp. LX40W]
MKKSLLTIVITAAFGAALSLTSINGLAAEQSADPCKTQANTLEINECGKQELAKKDKELNAAYQQLMKKLAPADKSDDTKYAEVKKQLIEAQKNWIKYRDADCSAKYTLYEQGSIRGIVHLSCLREKTEQRTKELLNWDPV